MLIERNNRPTNQQPNDPSDWKGPSSPMEERCATSVLFHLARRACLWSGMVYDRAACNLEEQHRTAARRRRVLQHHVRPIYPKMDLAYIDVHNTMSRQPLNDSPLGTLTVHVDMSWTACVVAYDIKLEGDAVGLCRTLAGLIHRVAGNACRARERACPGSGRKSNNREAASLFKDRLVK